MNSKQSEIEIVQNVSAYVDRFYGEKKVKNIKETRILGYSCNFKQRSSESHQTEVTFRQTFQVLPKVTFSNSETI